jgi:protease PrsW
VLYMGRAFAEDSALVGQGGGVLAVLILRGILSPFAHPLFTSMTGIGCGLAASSRSPVARVLYVLVGYGFAVLLHALWNGSATFGDGGAFLGVYLFIMAPLFLAVFLLVVWQRRREQRTVASQLPGFAMAGWIAPSEVALLSTLAGRGRWRRAVRQRSGKEAAKAVTEYQTAVTELAFLRARMSRGAVGPHADEWHRERLATLCAARARAMGQPQALTAAWLRPPPSGWAPPPPPPPGWQPQPSPPPGWSPGPQGGGAPPRGTWGPPPR